MRRVRARRSFVLCPVLGLFLAAAAGLAMPASSGAEEGGLSDTAVGDAVEDELSVHLVAPLHSVQVEVAEGVVTLSGSVPHLLARRRAEGVAQTVRGVRAVVNRLEVSPPAGRPDEELARDVRNALRTDPATGSYDVQVQVDGGRVTLTGTAGSWQAKELAGTVASSVRGVIALKNEVAVEYRVRRSDEEIEEEIRSALSWDVRLRDEGIEVEVDDGVAILRGTVPSASEDARAAAVAQVAGITEVDDSALTVEPRTRGEGQPIPPAPPTDEEITAAVARVLEVDPRVDRSRIGVETRRGAVTLRGTVASLRAREAAARDARNTKGVIGVTNRIKVQTPKGRTDSEIAGELRGALERDAYLEPYSLTVTVRGGVARLKGEVDRRFEKRRASEVAQGVQGVLEVANGITVTSPDRPPYRYSSVDIWWGEDPGLAYQSPYYISGSDAEMRDAIQAQLFWSPFVDADQVLVSVDDGVATLTGRVNSIAEARAAEANAYDGGAIRVKNRLQIEPAE